MDALPDRVAVLDRGGRVLAANRSWTLDAGGCRAGASYLEVCDRAARGGDPSAGRLHTALVGVLGGARPSAEVDYPDPTGDRWWRAEIRRLPDDAGGRDRTVVRHLEVTEWVRTREALRTQAVTDPLTGLVNRRVLDDRLGRILGPAGPDQPTALLLADVDHFKAINDVHGHLAGDRCLAQVAQWLRQHTRPQDLICRWGGDEFVVLVQAPGAADVEAVESRLRRWAGGSVAGVPVTLTWGSAHARAGDTPGTLLARADHELRLAKSRRDDRDRGDGLRGRRLAVVPSVGRYPDAVRQGDTSPLPAPRLHSSGDRASVS
ncbi:GGDEF domain-containing protein [Nakamurella endophytica]